MVDRDRVQSERFQRWVAKQKGPVERDGYLTTAGVFQAASGLNRARSGVVQPMLIGHSVERRPIWAFRVRRPDEEVHTKILVFAGIHALEWISTQTASHALNALALAPPRGVEVVVVPLLNPAGRARVESDLAAGVRQYRRGNARHVDLNRDFAVNREAKAVWRHIIPGYYRSSRAPLSQPETRALDRLLDRERFDVALSLHAFGGVHAPAGLWERPEDGMSSIGSARHGQAQGAHAYKVRQLSRWGFFFRAHGAEIDHIYGKYGTKAFLVELTARGCP